MQNRNAMAVMASLVFLAAGIARAQQPLPVVVPLAQVQSSGMAGIAAGQTARLNALNPGVPAPLATAASCPAHVAFMDDQGNVLKSADIKVDPGKSVTVDLNRDTDAPTSAPRLPIRAVLTFTPPTPAASSGFGGFLSVIATCHLVPTLEIFDNATSKTQFVLTDFGSTAGVLTGVFTPGTVTH